MSFAVETRGLAKTYRNGKALDGLDLNVPEGCIYGFLGPNGAGKTTTLKILTGMTRPSGGSVHILGRPVDFGSGRNLSDVGFLPDVPGFYDWMTAGEFLAFCAGLFSLDRAATKQRVGGLLEQVGLADTGKKKIGGFSRGMKQRLGIAQALVNQPRVVLLDEPVSALDPVGRKEVMDIIQGLSGRHTVFFSTHVLADVERVCDRVVIINRGKALLEGSLEDIKAMNAPHAIELEAEDTCPEELAAWLGMVAGVSRAVPENGRRIVLTVTDLALARAGILRLVVEKGVRLRRFEVLEPTLEDIFMKVVNSDA